MAADEKPAEKPADKPAAKAAEKPAAVAKAPKRKSARKPKPKAAAPAKAAAAPKAEPLKKSGKFLVLHPVTHNGVHFVPGDHMDFEPWPVGIHVTTGKPVMADEKAIKVHVDDLIARGVVIPAGKDAAAALAKADDHREVAAHKAG